MEWQLSSVAKSQVMGKTRRAIGLEVTATAVQRGVHQPNCTGTGNACVNGIERKLKLNRHTFAFGKTGGGLSGRGLVVYSSQ